VTTPVLIAVLATVAGILIVGVGGGLVRPMQARWETWLDRAAAETQVIREKAQAYAAGREDVRQQMAADRTEPLPTGAHAPAMAPSQPGVYQSSAGSPPPPAPTAPPAPPAPGSLANDETQRIERQ
jgi:hypothetical protein